MDENLKKLVGEYLAKSLNISKLSKEIYDDRSYQEFKKFSNELINSSNDKCIARENILKYTASKNI